MNSASIPSCRFVACWYRSQVARKCSLDNTAYGLALSHTGKAWTGLISGINYEYSTADCDLTGVTLPPQAGNLPPISREIFRRIATRVLRASAALVGSELTRESGFLDYSLWAAVGYRSGLNTYGLDYYHDREEFAQLEADTVIGSMSFPLSDRLDLELRIGVSDSDLDGSVAFGGLTLIAYLGRTHRGDSLPPERGNRFDAPAAQTLCDLGAPGLKLRLHRAKQRVQP